MDLNSIFEDGWKNKKVIAIIVAVLILLILFGGWFYSSKISNINYLIPGVPYYGIYNLFFLGADSTVNSSIMEILGFWGDKRFTVSDLTKEFPPEGINTHVSDLEKFFRENGYDTYRWGSSDAGGEINQIKKYVNSRMKVPVIVFQRRSLDDAFVNFGFRVVIGVFDKNKKIIVQDHDLGNNYEISFQDFERMFDPKARIILAVWPSQSIQGFIEGPNYNLAYPQRLEAMDKIGEVLVTKGAKSARYFHNNEYEQAIQAYKEFIGGDNLNYFPLAFRLWWLSNLGAMYVYAGQPGEAIEIINERVLPFNQNVNEMIPGWFLPSQDKLFYPYLILSKAYLGKGDKNLAIDNYNEAKKIVTAGNFQEKDIALWFGQLEEELFPEK